MMMTNQMELSTEVDLLKKQLAEETKEKYALYKRIKELNEEISFLKNKSPELSSNSDLTIFKGIEHDLCRDTRMGTTILSTPLLRSSWCYSCWNGCRDSRIYA